MENTVTVSKTYRVQSGSEIDPSFTFRSALWQILEPFLRGSSGFGVGLMERFITMKWFNTTAQGFSPGLTWCKRCPESG
ncbi:MAG TPA: hypothetical protein VE641_16350, partial [Chthoniobacterales bacterium]|nr:hypothetical protein [Chthoniobacterales bacterium]